MQSFVIATADSEGTHVGTAEAAAPAYASGAAGEQGSGVPLENVDWEALETRTYRLYERALDSIAKNGGLADDGDDDQDDQDEDEDEDDEQDDDGDESLSDGGFDAVEKGVAELCLERLLNQASLGDDSPVLGRLPASLLRLKFLALSELAKIKLATGRVEKALDLCLRAVDDSLGEENVRTDPVPWMMLGRVAFELHRLGLARHAFEQAMAIGDDFNWHAADMLLDVLYAIDDHEACVAVASHMLKLEPEHVKAAMMKAKIEFESGYALHLESGSVNLEAFKSDRQAYLSKVAKRFEHAHVQSEVQRMRRLAKRVRLMDEASTLSRDSSIRYLAFPANWSEFMCTLASDYSSSRHNACSSVVINPKAHIPRSSPPVSKNAVYGPELSVSLSSSSSFSSSLSLPIPESQSSSSQSADADVHRDVRGPAVEFIRHGCNDHAADAPVYVDLVTLDASVENGNGAEDDDDDGDDVMVTAAGGADDDEHRVSLDDFVRFRANGRNNGVVDLISKVVYYCLCTHRDLGRQCAEELEALLDIVVEEGYLSTGNEHNDILLFLHAADCYLDLCAPSFFRMDYDVPRLIQDHNRSASNNNNNKFKLVKEAYSSSSTTTTTTTTIATSTKHSVRIRERRLSRAGFFFHSCSGLMALDAAGVVSKASHTIALWSWCKARACMLGLVPFKSPDLCEEAAVAHLQEGLAADSSLTEIQVALNLVELARVGNRACELFVKRKFEDVVAELRAPLVAVVDGVSPRVFHDNSLPDMLQLLSLSLHELSDRNGMLVVTRANLHMAAERLRKHMRQWPKWDADDSDSDSDSDDASSDERGEGEDDGDHQIRKRRSKRNHGHHHNNNNSSNTNDEDVDEDDADGDAAAADDADAAAADDDDDGDDDDDDGDDMDDDGDIQDSQASSQREEKKYNQSSKDEKMKKMKARREQKKRKRRKKKSSGKLGPGDESDGGSDDDKEEYDGEELVRIMIQAVSNLPDVRSALEHVHATYGRKSSSAELPPDVLECLTHMQCSLRPIVAFAARHSPHTREQCVEATLCYIFCSVVLSSRMDRDLYLSEMFAKGHSLLGIVEGRGSSICGEAIGHNYQRMCLSAHFDALGPYTQDLSPEDFADGTDRLAVVRRIQQCFSCLFGAPLGSGDASRRHQREESLFDEVEGELWARRLWTFVQVSKLRMEYEVGRPEMDSTWMLDVEETLEMVLGANRNELASHAQRNPHLGVRYDKNGMLLGDDDDEEDDESRGGGRARDDQAGQRPRSGASSEVDSTALRPSCKVPFVGNRQASSTPSDLAFVMERQKPCDQQNSHTLLRDGFHISVLREMAVLTACRVVDQASRWTRSTLLSVGVCADNVKSRSIPSYHGQFRLMLDHDASDVDKVFVDTMPILERACRELILRNPQDAQAWYLLGLSSYARFMLLTSHPRNRLEMRGIRDLYDVWYDCGQNGVTAFSVCAGLLAGHAVDDTADEPKALRLCISAKSASECISLLYLRASALFINWSDNLLSSLKNLARVSLAGADLPQLLLAAEAEEASQIGAQALDAQSVSHVLALLSLTLERAQGGGEDEKGMLPECLFRLHAFRLRVLTDRRGCDEAILSHLEEDKFMFEAADTALLSEDRESQQRELKSLNMSLEDLTEMIAALCPGTAGEDPLIDERKARVLGSIVDAYVELASEWNSEVLHSSMGYVLAEAPTGCEARRILLGQLKQWWAAESKQLLNAKKQALKLKAAHRPRKRPTGQDKDAKDEARFRSVGFPFLTPFLDSTQLTTAGRLMATPMPVSVALEHKIKTFRTLLGLYVEDMDVDALCDPSIVQVCVDRKFWDPEFAECFVSAVEEALENELEALASNEAAALTFQGLERLLVPLSDIFIHQVKEERRTVYIAPVLAHRLGRVLMSALGKGIAAVNISDPELCAQVIPKNDTTELFEALEWCLSTSHRRHRLDRAVWKRHIGVVAREASELYAIERVARGDL